MAGDVSNRASLSDFEDYISPRVPRLPIRFLPRLEEQEAIKNKFFVPTNVPVADADIHRGVIIQGMGGSGKSVLAAVIARDESMRQLFSGGIFWVTLGQSPQLMVLQSELAQELGEETPVFSNIATGKQCLKALLKKRTCLIVLDDVWEKTHLLAFDVLGERSQLLVTTRDKGLAIEMGLSEYSLDILSVIQSRDLIAIWTCCEAADLPIEANEIVKECGYLPLALSMAGAMLKQNGRWGNVLQRLQRADLDKIKQNFPNYPYPNLLKMLQVSVDALDSKVREKYLDFSVFPEDARIPEAVLCTLWKREGEDQLDIEDMIDELVSKSLLHRDEQRRLFVHDLQHDYITRLIEHLPALHKRLLDAYAECCDYKWHQGPKDGYFFDYLAYHLNAIGQIDELYSLLFNYNWLEARLSVSKINGLLTDYDFFPEDKTLSLVKAALRLSIHVLAPHPSQLTERLWGHLSDRPQVAIQALLKQAALKKHTAWLQPIQANLTSPDGPLRLTLSGHSNDVFSVVLTPNGKQCVSASYDNTLRLWDLDTGEVLRTFYGLDSRATFHSRSYRSEDWIHSVAITPDGKHAVSGSGGYYVDEFPLKVWDLETGEELLSLLGHTGIIFSVAITPDGKYALSASDDGTLRLWNLDVGQPECVLSGHNSRVTSVAITPDGRSAISVSHDTTVKVWDLESRELLFSTSGHRNSVKSVAITPDGKYAVSAATDTSLKLWDLRTGQELRTYNDGSQESYNSVAVIPDGKRIISSSYKFNDRANILKVWDMETGKVLRVISGHSSEIYSVAVTPDGRYAVSAAASPDNTLKVWDLDVEYASSSLKGHDMAVNSLAITPDGCRFISTSNDTTLKIWDLATRQPVRTLSGHSGSVTSALLIHHGKHILSGSRDTRMMIWDLETGEALQRVHCQNTWVNSVAVTPDGLLAISASGTFSVAATSLLPLSLRAWNLETGKELYWLKGHNELVNSVAITPDGKYLLSGSDDTTIKLWDLETRETIHTFSGHRDAVQSVIVTSDGKSLITGSDDTTIKLWNLETGQCFHTLSGHAGSVCSVTVSATGKHLLSCSSDKSLKIWDMSSKTCLATFMGDHAFLCCAMTPDEGTVIAGDASGQVHFFTYLTGVYNSRL